MVYSARLDSKTVHLKYIRIELSLFFAKYYDVQFFVGTAFKFIYSQKPNLTSALIWSIN